MVTFSPDASDVFRDHNTKFIPSSGAYNPAKSYIRTYLKQIEDAVSAVATADNFQGAWDASTGSFPSGAQKGYSWVASTAGTVGGKYFGEGDQIIALLNGASTSTYAGNWVAIPAWTSGVVPAVDEGAGTANAIQITTEKPVSDDTIVVFTLDTSTTGSPVTISINGGAALTMKTNRGNDASALTAGMEVWGRPRSSDSTFRLSNDQDVSALVAQAEEAAADAIAAKEAAEAAANAGYVYDSDADFQGAAIGNVLNFIRTAGNTTPGDGGGLLWMKIDEPDTPSVIDKEVDSKWWQIGTPNAAVLSVTAFGATTDVGQTASTRRQLLQDAIDAAALLKVRLFIPAGTWLIDEELDVPSGSRISGAGRSLTIIKVTDAADKTHPGLLIGYKTDAVKDIEISDLTVDWNRDRWDNTGTVGYGPEGTAVAIFHAEDVTFINVGGLDGYKHCFDISANDYVAENGLTTYATKRCKNIKFYNCYAKGSGDDTYTTHHSDNTYFWACVSDGPWDGSDGHAGYTSRNGFEFDDGTIGAWAIACVANNCKTGFDAHNHENQPAPTDLHWIDCIADGCMIGFELTDGHYQALTVRSPQAKGAVFSGCVVKNPIADPDENVPTRGFEIDHYGETDLIGCRAIGSSTISFAMSDAFRIAGAAIDISAVGCVADNWPVNGVSGAGGFSMTSAVDRISLTNCRTKNSGIRAFVCTSTSARLALANCMAEGVNEVGGIAFRFGSGSTKNTNASVINCFGVNYATEFSNGSSTYSSVGRTSWP